MTVTDPAATAPTAPTWEALTDLVTGCTACAELAATRTHVVPGTRPPGAEVLLVGEAPGAQEDEAGVPFVGRSGQLLDELLGETGLRRDQVAVANVLKCRPPANRKPKRAEVARCRPWLDRQLELVDPVVVVALGGTAAEWFFGPGARIATLRADVHRIGGRPVIVTYHPSAAIRFGPNGAPLAALREDLAMAAGLVARLTRPVPLRVTVPTADDMTALGSRLAAVLRAGDLVLLSGDLGAGKTTLTRGLGASLGVRGAVTSPTFVIARVHPAGDRDGVPLVHVDAYRLGDLAEVDDLDLDASLADSVTVVEWGEGKVEGLAESRLELTLHRGDDETDETRTVLVRGVGERWAGVDLAAVTGALPH